MPKVVTDLIEFAADSIIESETESKNHVQFTNVLEKIVADGTNDNGDDDQSEHAIQSMHLTNGNNGLRKIDSGTQLQPLSTEKPITRSISRKFPPALHFTIQTDMMDSEETVV
ncbi:MAG: hypothetical protein EZS28_035645 [Streblomastix strix]|uniref:Uncharacterized protein n=1 Tax=Streblomastix strix TaxID=222440 RepID=A0A5J4UDX0_9EUKA|nr:MAG: hypothetical protein EZS28_035645 [Streblomastix strix]